MAEYIRAADCVKRASEVDLMGWQLQLNCILILDGLSNEAQHSRATRSRTIYLRNLEVYYGWTSMGTVT